MSDSNYDPNDAKLKHYCMECHHYITEHVEEKYMKSCGENGQSISPYIDKCLKKGCECEKYVQPDIIPSVRDTAAYLKDFNYLIKKMGLVRAKDVDLK